METFSLVEWGVGGIFVGVNAYRRYNTPTSINESAVIQNFTCNRESTTFQNFITYFFFYLAGLQNSDVDIDGAEKEFDHCLELIESGELRLEERLHNFGRLPLLSSLMPFIASSVAFADGVYLEQEREIVNRIKGYSLSPESALG